MRTITVEEQKKIAAYLDTHVLPKGLGTEESACSIAAINLALSGVLTDKIPDCMSYVIGRWIIRIQDAMPDAMRNSAKWKSLLPLAAGTGRNADDEKHRMNLILNWMWETVLPRIQYIADSRGFSEKWKVMCEQKTAAAADAAYAAADADAYAAYAAADAAAAADTAYADAADAAAYAAARAARDADNKTWDQARREMRERLSAWMEQHIVTECQPYEPVAVASTDERAKGR